MKFIGRANELAELMALFCKQTASMVVIKGRRRIGKSRLLDEYSHAFQTVYKFSGLPPVNDTLVSAQLQRDEFAFRLAKQSGETQNKTDDWSELFWRLAEKTKQGRVLIILDEISWMAAQDLHFLGKLKNAWDLSFKQNDQIVLAICGSASAWIDKNILSSTGFLGRESLTLSLKELPLVDCMAFWGAESNKMSAFEKLKFLAVTGGVPRYLEHLNPYLSADDNIRNLCFNESGILFTEFEKIFSDLFYPQNANYKKILKSLVAGILNQKTITQKIGLKRGGDISEYLSDLVKTEFLARDFTFNIKTNMPSNLSHYRLKDNYSRFYLKYIERNAHKIRLGNMKNISLSELPGWNSIIALQFENLVLSNRDLIKDSLKISASDIVSDNPYFQKANTKQEGCQIDYLIETKHRTIYVCEIKLSKYKIGLEAAKEVKEKIKRLHLPKHYSYRTVLIHVNGMNEALEDSQFFSYIIDFSKFLE